MWILWKKWLWKCEFCEKWDFENVNFVKSEIFTMWTLWKVRFSQCDFLKKWGFFAPVWKIILLLTNFLLIIWHFYTRYWTWALIRMRPRGSPWEDYEKHCGKNDFLKTVLFYFSEHDVNQKSKAKNDRMEFCWRANSFESATRGRKAQFRQTRCTKSHLLRGVSHSVSK